jgi:hypothetical protein
MSRRRIGLIVALAICVVAIAAFALNASGQDGGVDLVPERAAIEPSSPYVPVPEERSDRSRYRRLTPVAIAAGPSEDSPGPGRISDGLSRRDLDFEPGYYIRARASCSWGYPKTPAEEFYVFDGRSPIIPNDIDSQYFWSDGCGPWVRSDW